MKIYYQIPMLLLIVFYLPTAWAESAEDSLMRGKKIGTYIAGTLGEQQTNYKILDYCSGQFPNESNLYTSAKEKWDQRNLQMVENYEDTIKNWMVDDGVSEDDIPSLMKQVDALMPMVGLMIGTQIQTLIKTFEEKPTNDRRLSCDAIATLIEVGGRDLKPDVVNIYNKYSSADNPSHESL